MIAKEWREGGGRATFPIGCQRLAEREEGRWEGKGRGGWQFHVYPRPTREPSARVNSREEDREFKIIQFLLELQTLEC